MKMLIHEKDLKTLNDTVIPMLCENYKCRFSAEFYQLKIRFDKLSELINKYYEGTLDFTLNCPITLLEDQHRTMSSYLHILKFRADIEGIDL